MDDLENFKIKLRDIIAEEVHNSIQKIIAMCNEEKFRFKITKEDEETTVFTFEDKSRVWQLLNFTLVMFAVEGVDVCIDDNIVSFGVDWSLHESFKTLEDLLKSKMIMWAKDEYIDLFYKTN